MISLTLSDKTRMLDLKVYAIEDEIEEEAAKLADDLVDKDLQDIQDVCISNFIGNVEYMYAEMVFIAEIAASSI